MSLLRQAWGDLSEEQKQDTMEALVTWSHWNKEAKALIDVMLPRKDS